MFWVEVIALLTVYLSVIINTIWVAFKKKVIQLKKRILFCVNESKNETKCFVEL